MTMVTEREKALWKLLDDIGTLPDVLKPSSGLDNQLCWKKMVEFAERRHAILETDGYTLFPPGEKAEEAIKLLRLEDRRQQRIFAVAEQFQEIIDEWKESPDVEQDFLQSAETLLAQALKAAVRSALEIPCRENRTMPFRVDEILQSPSRREYMSLLLGNGDRHQSLLVTQEFLEDNPIKEGHWVWRDADGVIHTYHKRPEF